MQIFLRIKRKILTCLMACMFIGGMGVETCAAEVVDAQAFVPDGPPTAVSRNVSCTVEKDGTVTYAAVLDSAMPVPDDGMLYLFELSLIHI